jgi:tripartite-type tricarboxylate transporter receptor subunit TctC
MPLRCFDFRPFAIAVLALSAGTVCSQNYPNKALRMITCEAGGGSDQVARLTAQGITPGLGQQVIVENRPCGVIPGQVTSAASPDGYTMLLSGNTLWTSPLLQSNAGYDVARDFSSITLVAASPTVLVVNPALPAASVKELIALAKARPGALNYAAAAIGSTNHLAGELFKSMAEVNIVAVSYKGTGPSMSALISGEVQLGFANAAAAMPHVKSGRLRALAVTSAQPSALVPGLPTVAAAVPGYQSASNYGMFAPARTPATIVSRLNREIVRFLAGQDTRDKLFSSGLEVVGSTEDELTRTVKSEIARLGKVIKDAGIREN